MEVGKDSDAGAMKIEDIIEKKTLQRKDDEKRNS